MTGNSITQKWCDTQQQVFKEDVYPFNKFGGMASMGKVCSFFLLLTRYVNSGIGDGPRHDARHVAVG
jgi:hypothetical protein